MTRQQKKVLLLLIGLGAAYFILFLFPNLTGAKDENMLTVFSVDEYAQYSHVLHMLTPGNTLMESLHNFLVYVHYFYGYPFYFLSAVSILPLKLIYGAGWTSHTQAIVTVMRQVVSVLPMLLAAGVLVWMRTRFQSAWKAAALFLLILSIPGLVLNNLWWHTDSLGVLFMVVVFFFLDRDDQHFGRNFFLAAAACGLSTGIKYFGLYFFLAIPIYLVWGLVTHKIAWKRTILYAALFVLVMAAALVASNPLLLLPQERAEIIATQTLQFHQITHGMLLRDTQPLFNWNNYPDVFRTFYGELLFILLALGGLVYGLGRSQRRWLEALILAWILPLTYMAEFTGTKRVHYLLPVVVLVVAGLANWFYLDGGEKNAKFFSLRAWRKWLPYTAALVIAVQVVLFVRMDTGLYTQTLYREQDSPTFAFYDHLNQAYLSKLPADMPLVFYRDWLIYVPPGPHWRVDINWNLASYGSLTDPPPDFILIEQANVALFADPATLEKAADPGVMRDHIKFYLDVRDDKVPGYHLLFGDGFGYAMVKDAIYQEYLSKP
jgi:hypothetical protein